MGYACRSGSTVPHPFVADWPNPENFAELAGKNKHPTKEPLVPRAVGGFAANAFGLHDMRGNVFEWTADWFERDYYSRSRKDDPEGPPKGYVKVVRGWDWVFIGSQCKDFHLVTPPWIRSRYVGFRVVMEMNPH
jgi:formylglycine-generating enzyme required for sulfatase activity